MDTVKILKELKGKGWNQANIARYCGVSQPLISYYVRTGNEPKHSLGEKLLELHGMVVNTDGDRQKQ